MKHIKGIALPDNDSYFTHVLSTYGAFEPGRLDAALKYVKNWRVSIDVGSHVGLRSQELAPKFRCVYSFEPQPDNYQCLVHNVMPYANVIPLNYALGNEAKEVTMRESSTRPGNSGSYFVCGGEGIEVRTLDSFDIRHVDLIKIDAEGYELLILEGGKETILQSKPIILMEEKNFKDRQGRVDIDFRAAGKLLESWGAVKREKLRNDVIYSW